MPVISRAGDQDALLVHAYKLLARPTRTFLEFGEEADATEKIQWWTFFFFPFFSFFFFAVQIGTHRGGDASGGPSRLTGLTDWQI